MKLIMQLDGMREKVAQMSGRDAKEVRFVVSPYRICPLGAHIDHQVSPQFFLLHARFFLDSWPRRLGISLREFCREDVAVTELSRHAFKNITNVQLKALGVVMVKGLCHSSMARLFCAMQVMWLTYKSSWPKPFHIGVASSGCVSHELNTWN